MSASTSALIEALGLALVHAVWQLTAAAVLLWAVLRLLDRHSAAARCAVATITLLSAPVLFLLTWSAHLDLAAAELAALGPLAAAVGPLPAGEAAPLPTARWSRVDGLAVVVGLWLVGLAVQSTLFLGGLRQLKTLRTDGVQAVSADLQQRVSALCGVLGIRQAVSVVSSVQVSVPTVVGLVHPVILLPGVALTGLSTAQLEAVLVHELAHVHRRDLWIGLAQQVVEILFFFHPAVWWISHRIRAEREMACDDIVVEHRHDPLTYAQALLQLAEHQQAPLVLAAAATDGSLRHRIARLVGTPPAPTRASRGLAAGIVVAALALVSAQHSAAADAQLDALVADFLAMEIALPAGETLSREAQDVELRGDLDRLIAAHAAIGDRLHVLLEDDPERWAVLAAVRAAQAREHLGRAISTSEIPDYLTEVQADTYRQGLEEKANMQRLQARERFVVALELAETHPASKALLAEAHDGLARLAAEPLQGHVVPLEPFLYGGPILEVINSGDLEEMLAMSQAISLETTGATRLWAETALGLDEAGRTEEALHWYLRVIGNAEDWAHDLVSRTNAAYCYQDLGQPREAIDMMLSAVAVASPTLRPVVLAELADLYVALGREREGRRWFRTAGELEIWAQRAGTAD